MSDNDLIQRGDAVDAAWEASSLELFTLGPGKIVARINAIPAVQPTVSPDVAALVEAAEKVRDSYWHSSDGIITGMYDLETALARVKGEAE